MARLARAEDLLLGKWIAIHALMRLSLEEFNARRSLHAETGLGNLVDP